MLLNESPQATAQRKQTSDMLQALQHASAVLNEIRVESEVV